MANKNTYSTYRTGSIKSFVLGDVETHTPKKVTYIKIRKGDRVCYLGEDGELVDEAHAKWFSDSREANEIVIKMRGDPRYKNCDVHPFETSYIPPREIGTKKDEVSAVCTDPTVPETDKTVIEEPVLEERAEQQPVPDRAISSEPAERRETEPRMQHVEGFPPKQRRNKTKTVVAVLLGIACLAGILAFFIFS